MSKIRVMICKVLFAEWLYEKKDTKLCRHKIHSLNRKLFRNRKKIPCKKEKKKNAQHETHVPLLYLIDDDTRPRILSLPLPKSAWNPSTYQKEHLNRLGRIFQTPIHPEHKTKNVTSNFAPYGMSSMAAY